MKRGIGYAKVISDDTLTRLIVEKDYSPTGSPNHEESALDAMNREAMACVADEYKKLVDELTGNGWRVVHRLTNGIIFTKRIGGMLQSTGLCIEYESTHAGLKVFIRQLGYIDPGVAL